MLVVDLNTPGVSLIATTSAQRQRTPSSYAKLVGAKAAINGYFFFYTDYHTQGLAVGVGAVWPASVDNTRYGNLAFGTPTNRVEIYQPAPIVPFDATWMKGSIGGRPGIVASGAVINNAGYGTHCTVRNPRTAVGLSQDKRTLYIAVVDGRSTASIGMTCNELGSLMLSVGAYTALSLDGGGSTSMYIDKLGVVNNPSDGSERVVANHLAVMAPVSTNFGVLRGIIYEGTDVSDAAGLYEFNVPAATYTITASKVGFITQTITRSVVAGQTALGNIGLVRAPITTDGDHDGILDTVDNCPTVANPDQQDLDHDGDGIGDACQLADGGMVEADGGTEPVVDAGVDDAGTEDSGTPEPGDGGTSKPLPHGYSSAPGLLLPALALWFAGRRRNGGRRPQASA